MREGKKPSDVLVEVGLAGCEGLLGEVHAHLRRCVVHKVPSGLTCAAETGRPEVRCSASSSSYADTDSLLLRRRRGSSTKRSTAPHRCSIGSPTDPTHSSLSRIPSLTLLLLLLRNTVLLLVPPLVRRDPRIRRCSSPSSVRVRRGMEVVLRHMRLHGCMHRRRGKALVVSCVSVEAAEGVGRGGLIRDLGRGVLWSGMLEGRRGARVRRSAVHPQWGL